MNRSVYEAMDAVGTLGVVCRRWRRSLRRATATSTLPADDLTSLLAEDLDAVAPTRRACAGRRVRPGAEPRRSSATARPARGYARCLSRCVRT